jgi:hypothetical protein
LPLAAASAFHSTTLLARARRVCGTVGSCDAARRYVKVPLIDGGRGGRRSSPPPRWPNKMARVLWAMMASGEVYRRAQPA